MHKQQKRKTTARNPLAENVNDLVGKDGAVKPAVPHKKEPLKPKKEAVNVISPDEDGSCKSGWKLREGSSKKFELMPKSLYLTFNIVDRFLSVKTVPRRELQLVGISSMLIACKYEEICAPEVSDFIAMSDNAYVREKVLLMEKAILGTREWYLTVPTPYVSLVRYIKAFLPSDKENMTFFFAELGLMNYSAVIPYCPSMLAASAVYAARCTLNRIPLWTETLKHHTRYSEDQLMECARLLVRFHSGAVALFPSKKPSPELLLMLQRQQKKPLAEYVNDLAGKDGAVKPAVPHEKESLKLKKEV
ncbi:UNVERIFIED_CONTAM: G2/mitotic-specific cyclin-2 [Sesamum indicum]